MIFFVLGCVSTTLSEEWNWSGNLFERNIEGFLPLQNAKLELFTEDMVSILETEDNPQSPYRSLNLSEEYRDEEIIFVLNGDNCHQSLWKGTAPTTGDAIWLNGSLFAQGKAYQQLIMNSLGLMDVEPLTNPTTQEASPYAFFWGEPAKPEDWTGVSISARLYSDEVLMDTGSSSEDTSSIQNQTTSITPLMYSLTDEGLFVEIESPISEDLPLSLFIFPELPTGSLELHVSRSSNLGEAFDITSTYPSTSGTWISAINFTLPAQSN